MIRFRTSDVEAMGSIPGLGNKIPHARRYIKKNEREWLELLSLCMNKNKTKKAQKLIYFEGISWQSSG